MIDVRLTTIALLLLSACSRAVAPQEVRAVIDPPTGASRAELTRAVSSALNGAAVTIANDALTRDNVLIIERAPLRDAKGVPLSGRELDRPERFLLVKVARQCVLVHERTWKRRTLTSTSCRVLQGRPNG